MKIKITLVLAVSATLCMVFPQSCATQRNIVVLRKDGSPAANVLVVYREVNIAIYNRIGAGYATNNGVYTFKSKNQTRIEAFDATNNWGRLSLGNKVNGVLHLDNPEYIGSVADYYISRQTDHESTIAKQLELILGGVRASKVPRDGPAIVVEPLTPKP